MGEEAAMDKKSVSRELKSPTLRQIVESLWTIIERLRSGEIQHQQAASETAAHKHMIQSIALDWLYNKKAKDRELMQRDIKQISDGKTIDV